MTKSDKPTESAQPPRSQVPIKWNTTNLQSSYADFCNANSTREEVVLNFGVNKELGAQRQRKGGSGDRSQSSQRTKSLCG